MDPLPKNLHLLSAEAVAKYWQGREDLRNAFREFLVSDAYILGRALLIKMAAPQELPLSGELNGERAYQRTAAYFQMLGDLERLPELEVRERTAGDSPWGHFKDVSYVGGGEE